MIKIAIVDDEEQTREQILRTLKENIQEQYEVEIKLYASGESFFEEIQKGETADILFTDIQMQQLDGVELGKLVRRLCPDMYIVFITSYEEYAAESYRIEAYQYILKRDMSVRLPMLVDKVIAKIEKEYTVLTLDSSSSVRRINLPFDQLFVVYRVRHLQQDLG